MVSSTSALRLGCKILFWPQSCVSDLAEVDFKIVWSIEISLSEQNNVLSTEGKVSCQLG